MDTLHSNNPLSTAQVADLLNVSRITIFRRIKDGSLKAHKVGRNYVISQEEFLKHFGKHPLDDAQKGEIRKMVTKVVSDYGETIRMLGGE